MSYLQMTEVTDFFNVLASTEVPSLLIYRNFLFSFFFEYPWSSFFHNSPYCCRNREEQNLVAYPHDGKIYFCTSRDIPPEHELFFYYSRDYARQLGK